MFSAGERMFGELIFPIAYSSILGWFNEVASTANYRNPQFKVPEVRPVDLEDAQVFDATEDVPENVPEEETKEVPPTGLASAQVSDTMKDAPEETKE